MAANEGEKMVVEETSAEKQRSAAEDVAMELPAPPGWTKKYMPKKGGTPHRNEIVFISPTGEEIKNKRQLDIYLRSHPGNPSSSEFDWGTGETPRRSARISEKAKAIQTPESERPNKRERKSRSKKEQKKDSDDVKEAPATEKVEATAAVDEKMKEAESGEDKSKEVIIAAETAVKEGALGQDSLNEVKENMEEKTKELEESIKVDAAGNEEKPEIDKPADAEILPPATDQKDASAEKEIKVVTLSEKEVQKDNETAVPKDAPSVKCDDGQHQPKASPVNC